jgi:Ca2+-binding RTX toxin-like protein
LKQLPAAQLACVTALAALLAGSASGGNYTPPPGDFNPAWLPDGSIAFTGGGVDAVNADGSGLRVAIAGSSWRLRVAPTLPLVAASGYVDGKQWLIVAATDGSPARQLVENGVPVGWLPDSSRLIFYVGSVLNPHGAKLFSIRPDGTDLRAYPPKVQGTPSPNGSRFVYVTADENGEGARLQVVSADGSALAVPKANPPTGTDVALVWSPDSSRVAYWSGSYLTVTRPGGAGRSYPVIDATAQGSIAWTPDGRAIYADGSLGLVRIDLASGKQQILRGIQAPSGVAVSPDGTRIAYSAGGECRDRAGIYVANADGSGRHRVSNSCRIYGTDGPDMLHGDFSQVVLGLGGDDTLYADDTYYYFDGDTLYGGPGNDRLVGGYARDTLDGGLGDDTLDGGSYADFLIGGRGHDHIFGGGGNDTIGAQDGLRDWIGCGTSGPRSGVREHDVVYADRVDVVARDCEIVHRR